MAEYKDELEVREVIIWAGDEGVPKDGAVLEQLLDMAQAINWAEDTGYEFEKIVSGHGHTEFRLSWAGGMITAEIK